MCIARVLSTSPIKLIVQIFQTGCYRNIKSGIHLAETLILFLKSLRFDLRACVLPMHLATTFLVLKPDVRTSTLKF